jgi:hypothetical protein
MTSCRGAAACCVTVGELRGRANLSADRDRDVASGSAPARVVPLPAPALAPFGLCDAEPRLAAAQSCGATSSGRLRGGNIVSRGDCTDRGATSRAHGANARTFARRKRRDEARPPRDPIIPSLPHAHCGDRRRQVRPRRHACAQGRSSVTCASVSNPESRRCSRVGTPSAVTTATSDSTTCESKWVPAHRESSANASSFVLASE